MSKCGQVVEEGVRRRGSTARVGGAAKPPARLPARPHVHLLLPIRTGQVDDRKACP